MLSYHRLKDNCRAFRTFTSLDRSEFDTLLPSFEVAWNTYAVGSVCCESLRASESTAQYSRTPC